MEFLGYRRPDGSVGIRNWVLLVPFRYEHQIAERIARTVRGTRVLVTTGCLGRPKRDRETFARVIGGLGRSPNVAGTILIGTAPETEYPEVDYHRLAAAIAEGGRSVEVLTVGDCGSAAAAVERGTALARRMVVEASQQRREPCGLGDLCLGVKCGVSDVSSGVAGNPTVGRAFDAVVGAGGTALFSENTEIIGAEHLLADRAATGAVADAILDVASRTEARARSTGEDIRATNPIPANIAAGISTLAEKSIGAIAKGGTSPLKGVLRYGERPEGRGLYFVDAWMSSYSLPAAYAAAGAQMCLYVMGGESLPTGVAMPTVSSGVVIPMLYLTGNPRTYVKMKTELDFNASPVLEGTESLDAAGERLLGFLAEVASGALTRTEALRHTDPVEIYFEGPVF